MEITVGIDVSKARLDVHLHPKGESFWVSNDEAGLDELCDRLVPLAPAFVGLEASGRYEQLAVAALAARALPVVVLNPAQVRHYAAAIGLKAKPIRSMPASSPCSWKRCGPSGGRCPMPKPPNSRR